MQAASNAATSPNGLMRISELAVFADPHSIWHRPSFSASAAQEDRQNISTTNKKAQNLVLKFIIAFSNRRATFISTFSTLQLLRHHFVHFLALLLQIPDSSTLHYLELVHFH